VPIRKFDNDIPAFLMTGYHDDPVLASPGKYGFNDGIANPFTLEEIEEILAKYF